MKNQIHIFPQPDWISTISCDGKPCGSGGSSCGSDSGSQAKGMCSSDSCGDSSACGFNEMIQWFADKHQELVEVKVADYTSLNLFDSLNELNKILETNSEDLRVTLENIELVFSQISPIISINNTLAFVGKTPKEEDLLEAIELYKLQ